ncbi:MAG: ribulose-phosphate 3-epimerase [Clostridiales bacterium]|jgi:quinolinate phosphoribosyl transferase, C-terminal domain protein|nr:ribulose-phosphate 3-epimerase [Clostridiales bacterium]
MEISTSILNIKEENITETFYNIEAAKTDYFHIDVMDGKFVSNNTVDKMQQYIDILSGITNTPIEVHLMVKDVKKYIDIFIPNNPTKIIFHAKALKNSEEVFKMIEYIKDNNIQVGLALNPEDSIDSIKEFIPKIHQVLVMTVNPGQGGQTLIPECIKKVKELKEYLDSQNLETQIEVDGGVNLQNIKEIASSGVDIAVAGTAIVNAVDMNYVIYTMHQA